jgi:hypothetical protein
LISDNFDADINEFIKNELGLDHVTPEQIEGILIATAVAVTVAELLGIASKSNAAKIVDVFMRSMMTDELYNEVYRRAIAQINQAMLESLGLSSTE